MLIEGAGFIDAVYMTVITVSTVGYREAFPLSNGGKLFTIVLIATGVGAGLYFLSVIAESVMEGRLRDIYRRGAMLRDINQLRDHVIVCGYGRFGQIVVQDLRLAGVDVVVIEPNPDLENDIESEGLPYVLDSATEDTALEQAGVRRARAIVIAVGSESDCVFITLAARELNPDIMITARSESEAAVRRIRQAGAHHVTSPMKIGGVRAAMSILRPSVMDFLEMSSAGVGEDIDLEEVRVDVGAAIEGTRIGELEAQTPGVRIVGLKRAKSPMRIIPSRDEEIHAGDHLVVIGLRKDLVAMALHAQSPSA
jgi:voltage-gated potassium channel